MRHLATRGSCPAATDAIIITLFKTGPPCLPSVIFTVNWDGCLFMCLSLCVSVCMLKFFSVVETTNSTTDEILSLS